MLGRSAANASTRSLMQQQSLVTGDSDSTLYGIGNDPGQLVSALVLKLRPLSSYLMMRCSACS
jgi:hypothetical protein